MRTKPSQVSGAAPGPFIGKLPASVPLHEQALNRLRGLIVHGELAPSATIVETDLSESLGISRTPLREALKLLAAEGLVELRSNRRAQIAPLRLGEIEQIFEVLSGVEGMAGRLAAARATSADLRRLRQLQERLERHHAGRDLDSYFLVNQDIHRCIVACSKNRVLSSTHEGLFLRAERARFFALSSYSRREESVAEHRAVLKALEARNGERAASALFLHVLHTGEAVKLALHHSIEAAEPAPDALQPNSGGKDLGGERITAA